MNEAVRLNKYLSAVGVCSRREADRFIDEGRILFNGRLPEKGQKVTDDDEILIDNKSIRKESRKVVLAYNKERGIICSTKDQGQKGENIVDRVNYPIRVYPIGRLDKDSEGLILLTNDGELVNGLLKSRYGHEKEYEVVCDKEISDADLKAMSKGGLALIEGDKRVSKPCTIRRMGAKSFNCILTEGMNRQIRRMCAHFGYEVQSLKRIRFMNIMLDGLKKGEWRELSAKEIEGLKVDGR